MPTPLVAGTLFANLTTGDIWGSSAYSCADIAEDFFYWFKNDGEMYKAALPGLTGKVTLTTMPNYGAMRAMVAHPTDPALLIYFNTTDGVNTINTTTGAIVQLFTTAQFNDLLFGGGLVVANLTMARVRGAGLLIHGESDTAGGAWFYDVAEGVCDPLFSCIALSRACENGPLSNELMITGYAAPSAIIFKIDLTKDETRMVAGTGAAGSQAGDALTEATFAMNSFRLFRMAADTYYVMDTDNGYARWIQDGQVGNYAVGIGYFLACVLPVRNMFVCVNAQSVEVFE